MKQLSDLLHKIKWELFTNEELIKKPELQQPMIKIINGLKLLVDNWGK